MNETTPRKLTIATSPDRPPWNVEWFAELDSTMDYTAANARAGLELAPVVVADYQRMGRGTHGRSWVAPPGTCLMFSLVLRSDFAVRKLTMLPLEIAQELQSAIQASFDLDVEVDPPNDLVVNNRKLAGILCQSHLRGNRVDWVVCGVGVNTNLEQAQVSVRDSTSILIETGQRVSHRALLADLLGAMECFRA